MIKTFNLGLSTPKCLSLFECCLVVDLCVYNHSKKPLWCGLSKALIYGYSHVPLGVVLLLCSYSRVRVGFPWAFSNVRFLVSLTNQVRVSSHGVSLTSHQTAVGYSQNIHASTCTSRHILQVGCNNSSQNLQLGETADYFTSLVVQLCIAPSDTMNASQQECSFQLVSARFLQGERKIGFLQLE